jgi:hypothetical protein
LPISLGYTNSMLDCHSYNGYSWLMELSEPCEG